jgi:hypothetical protein
MEALPLENYSSAENKYSLGGFVPFGKSLANKKGVMIVIESNKGIKFGAFFSASIPFTNDIEESHFDKQAVLFNITS